MFEIVDKVGDNTYPVRMTNVTPIRQTDDETAINRGSYVRKALSEERWSISAAAARMGLAKSTLASRMKGETLFMADELEVIAGLIKRDPVDFYRDYLAAKDRTLDYGSVDSSVSDIMEAPSLRIRRAAMSLHPSYGG